MTLNPDRVRECLWLLRELIHVDKKYKWNNLPLADILPFLEKDLARAIIGNDEQAEATLSWLASAIFYMRGDTDELPRIELVFTID